MSSNKKSHIKECIYEQFVYPLYLVSYLNISDINELGNKLIKSKQKKVKRKCIK